MRKTLSAQWVLCVLSEIVLAEQWIFIECQSDCVESQSFVHHVTPTSVETLLGRSCETVRLSAESSCLLQTEQNAPPVLS